MFEIRIQAMKTQTKPAYIMGNTGEVITFGKLETQVNRCSHYFRNLGLEPKDHISVLMENNSRFLEVVLAASVAGLYYTTISGHLKTTEIAYIINDSDSTVLVTSYAMKDIIGGLKESCPRLKHVLMINGNIDETESYEKEIAGFPETPIPHCEPGRDMLYSSGTSGRPKGVIAMEEHIETDGASMFVEFLDFGSETIYLSTAPLYHSAPLRFCLMVLNARGTVIIMKKYDSLEALALIEKYKVTHSQWVPTMFIRMLRLSDEERKRYNLSSHKLAIHAAAPCPVHIKEEMIQWWGPILFEFYSGTEGNSVIAITSEEWMKHKGSVGKCYVGKIHVLDENFDELPVGQPGTVFIEGGRTFEYHNDPAKTTESRSPQGWNTIGDIGYVDNEGYLYLTDRKANMIISGGVNIYPQEVENILIMHPKVLDVAVLGVPHEEFGEEVKAVVQLADMSDAGPELESELRLLCQKHLANLKCPKTYDFQNDLPRTPSGKLFKRLLKERYK
jgi:acyl-CoA synthetase (AMP-forming)/AMP-acid ligase II